MRNGVRRYVFFKLPLSICAVPIPHDLGTGQARENYAREVLKKYSYKDAPVSEWPFLGPPMDMLYSEKGLEDTLEHLAKTQL